MIILYYTYQHVYPFMEKYDFEIITKHILDIW